MAKVGTAHIEIKPVLNEEALEAIIKRLEDAFMTAFENVMKDRWRIGDAGDRSPDEVIDILVKSKAGTR